MMQKNPALTALFAIAFTVIFALALSFLPAASASATDLIDDPDPSPTPLPMPKAMKGDLIVGDMPVPVDQGGSVLVRLPLLYKGMPARGGGLGSLEIWPVLTVEGCPFEVTSTSNLKTIMDMRADIVNNRSVEYVEFNLPVKPDTLNGTYKLTFHARYMHMWQDPQREQPAEDDLVIQVKIGGFIEPTPTPKPTREPTPIPPPQPVPKIIIETFLTGPADVMAGEEFDLTLSLRNTSEKTDVSNIKCTLDGGEAVVPVSGSNTFYVPMIEKQGGYETRLRMAAQPNASPKPHPIKVSMEYEYKADGLKEASMTETFTLKVQQIAKLVLDKPRTDPSELFEGEEFNLIMPMFNMGKATLYNVSVTIDGDEFTPEQQTYFVGTMAPGASNTYDVMVMVGGGGMMDDGFGMGYAEPSGPVKVAMAVPARMMPAGGGMMPSGGGSSGLSGPVSGDVVVTYEDENGKETEMRMPFTVTVLSVEEPDMSAFAPVGPDGMPIEVGPDGLPVGEGGAQSSGGLFGLPMLYVILLGAGVLAVSGVIALVFILRARRKKNED